MLSVKMLKPYYVKEEKTRIRVVLAYQYFSLSMDDELYYFVPMEAREIRINRETQQIENKDVVFVFQKGKQYHRISLAELMMVKDFKEHLASILNPYIVMSSEDIEQHNINQVILELERSNILRLIDRALDEKNEENFQWYTTKLNEM